MDKQILDNAKRVCPFKQQYNLCPTIGTEEWGEQGPLLCGLYIDGKCAFEIIARRLLPVPRQEMGSIRKNLE